MTSLLQISEFDFGKLSENQPPPPAFFPFGLQWRTYVTGHYEDIDRDKKVSAGSDCLFAIARADIMNG